MIAKLLLLFTIIPMIELLILIPLGQEIGTIPTVAIIFITGLAGATLGKYQGSSAWKRIKEELNRGELPGDSILDGLAVLLASAFLVTPGILTDLTGFLLLIPFTRAPIRKLVRKRLDKWLAGENVGFLGMSGFDDLADPYGGYGADTYQTPEGQTVFDYGERGGSDVIIDVTAQTKENSEAREQTSAEVKSA